MYRTQQKHVCSVPLCYWYYTRASNFLYISATIGLSKTSHWCIPTCFSRNIISSRHPKGNYILEQKPNFYATFLRSYRTKTDISCLSRANMAKITPDLAKSDKPFQTLFNRMFPQPQRKLHWMKDTTLSYRKNTSEAFARLSLQSSKMATSKTNTGIIYNEIIYDPYKTEIHSIHLI